MPGGVAIGDVGEGRPVEPLGPRLPIELAVEPWQSWPT
jgi:hypothetical protein